MRRYCILTAFLPIFTLLCCTKGTSVDGPAGKLTVTSYKDLDHPVSTPDSHKGRTAFSMLTPVGDSYIELGSDMLETELPIYPRFIKTSDGRYLMFYHEGVWDSSKKSCEWAGRQCAMVESVDLKEWSGHKYIFPIQKNVNSTAYGDVITRAYSGAHPVRLANGDILVVSAYRCLTDFRHRVKDNGLAIKTSSDEGKSWTMEKRINVGTCWEPRPLVLPSGRVIIYYTDSCPYIEGVWSSPVISSGVSYIYSDDNGKTWKPDNPLKDHLWAYRQFRDSKDGVNCYTDQMPGVIKLNGSNTLVGVGESNMAPCSSTTTDFYVSIAYSNNDGSWGEPDARDEMPAKRRNKFCKGTAPTIEIFPSGETVLTYNFTDGKSNVFRMRMGDHLAENFSDEIIVFGDEGTRRYGFWGAVLIDGHLMIAGIGGSGGANGIGYKMKLGQFYLNHDITASSHPVNVDGKNDEWLKTDEALFVGSDSPLHATLRCSKNGNRLYFLAEVDGTVPEGNDYISVYLSSPAKSSLSSGDICMKISPMGTSRTSVFDGRGWITEDVDCSWKTAVGSNCYAAEFSLPTDNLPAEQGEILVNFGVNGNDNKFQSLKPTTDTDTSEWLKIHF